MSDVLYLPIKSNWFGMICSGEKLEEYRAISPYWVVRIQNKRGSLKFVELRNGYSKNCRKARFLIRCIEVKRGNPAWGAPVESVISIGIGDWVEI